MYLYPNFYSWLVRPKFGVRKYITNVLCAENNFRGKSVLDLACGTGDIAFLFDQETYLGIDADPRRISFAQKKFPNYTFATISNSTIPVSSESYDYVVIIAGLHHMSDKIVAQYVQEIRRILKPHGKLIGIEPCKYESWAFSNVYMDTVDNGDYIRTETEYKKLFAHSRFVTKPPPARSRWVLIGT